MVKNLISLYLFLDAANFWTDLPFRPTETDWYTYCPHICHLWSPCMLR